MRTIVLFLMCSVLIVAGSSAMERKSDNKQPGLEPELADLVEKIDAKTATIETIKARFTQRKEVSLLKEPSVMGGNFYFKRQNGFKFDFDPKDDLLIVITAEETISLSHGAKQADRIKMKKRYGRLVERLLSDKLKSLSENFDIRRATPLTEGGDHHLILEPTKRRLKKRFQDIQIWINPDYLIYKIKVTRKDGDTYELSLDKVVLNEAIDASFFEVTIPEDYTIGDRMEFLFGSGATL